MWSSATEFCSDGRRFALLADAEVLDMHEAAHQLATWARGLDERERREWAWLLGDERSPSRDPLETLLCALRGGRFAVVSLGPARPAAVYSQPQDVIDLADLASSDEHEDEPEPEPEPEPLTFVAFRFVDDEDEPLAERPFVLHLADGRSVQGTTDAYGCFRVDDVQVSGECVVEFLAYEDA